MKKILFFQLLCWGLVFAYPPPVCSGQINNKEECEKEKQAVQDLDKQLQDLDRLLNDNRSMISHSKSLFDDIAKNMYDNSRTDEKIKNLKMNIDGIRTLLKETPEDVFYKQQLLFYQAEHDLLLEYRLKNQVGQSIDPKNNDMQKALVALEANKKEFENEKKKTLSEMRSHTDKLSKLNCEAKNTGSSETSFTGAWNLTERNGTMIFTFLGGGTDLIGEGAYIIKDIITGEPSSVQYSVSGCKVLNDENNIQCSFTSRTEDEATVTVAKGTVKFKMEGNKLTSVWEETAPPATTLKSNNSVIQGRKPQTVTFKFVRQ